jgi:uncharacterized protein (TIGR00375 family)
MHSYFADLHIHIGRTNTGRPVKITASNTLTLERILVEASDHKGINMIGVIDCHVPEVLETIEQRINDGTCMEHEDGGIQFKDTTLLLGSEIEIYDKNCQGPIHVLVFLPTLESMKQFSLWLAARMKNVTLSSQRIYEEGIVLQQQIKELSGLFIPAHIFTPFKSLYGKGVEKSLSEVFDPTLIDAVELGLSSNTEMADGLSELHQYPFVTNSDAHSLAKIGREYQKIRMEAPTFQELKKALKNQDGRRIESNYGLNPLLGKYHQSTGEIKGVSDRLKELSDAEEQPVNRPPYIHQVPLQFIPGVGPKMLERLKDYFKTEMTILHEAEEQALARVVPDKIVKYILAAREGVLEVKAGGGGIYGKVK